MGNNSNIRARRKPAPNPSNPKASTKKTIWMIVLLLVLIVAGGGCGFISATMSNLPDVSNVRPSASSQIYDVHGNLITTVHSTENRLPVPINEVPKELQDAFVATEDSRFYSHHGIDPIGILRAIWVNVVHSGVAEGGSTITQQLARNAFLSQDRTLKRKISEALLALKIEQHYTKQEILEMYMNQIYFGQGAYGVQSAAHVYFGKDVRDLTLAQCAMLAGLPQSPNYYSPFNNLEAGKKRQAIVLGQMVKYGYLTQDKADAAREADLGLVAKQEQTHENNNASYFINYVIAQISEKYGDDAIYKDGLKIYTTLDMDAQNAARIFAKQKGDTILEMTPHGQALEEWTKNLDWETEAKPLWQKTSKDFAGSTVGEAHVFIYEPKYRGANSVWEQDELPILKKKGIPVFEHRIDADGNIKVKQIHH